MESIKIEEISSKPQEALNLKSEWGGSKLPGIQVTKPKGTARTQEKLEGVKRIRAQENTDNPERGNLPESEQSQTRKRAKMEPDATKETQEEVKLIRRKIEVVKETGNGKEGTGLEKPANLRTFTQLKIQEVLTRKSSWSPGKGGAQERKKSGHQSPDSPSRKRKRRESKSPRKTTETQGKSPQKKEQSPEKPLRKSPRKWPGRKSATMKNPGEK